MAPCLDSHAVAVGRPEVDRVPRHVRRRVGGGHPSGGFLFRAVLRDRLLEQLFLVLRGTPAAVDEEPDPVVRGISCRSAQGAEESGIKLGHTRDVVIEDRRAVGDGTVGLAECTAVRSAKDAATLARRAEVLTGKDVTGDAVVEDEDGAPTGDGAVDDASNR